MRERIASFLTFAHEFAKRLESEQIIHVWIYMVSSIYVRYMHTSWDIFIARFIGAYQ